MQASDQEELSLTWAPLDAYISCTMGRNEALMATIALLMHWRGLKQTDLAERSGIAKGQISKYLSGITTPQLPQLFRIIDALETDDLLFWYVFQQVRRLQSVVRPRLLGASPPLDDPLLEAVLGSVLGKPPPQDDGEAAAAESIVPRGAEAGLPVRPPLETLTRRLIATVRDLADSGRALNQSQRRILEALAGIDDEPPGGDG
jgi:transcriptional regulator with XRE-family HTH domain